ncbi:MAG: YlbF family regulator [Firmicutes bacterium]|nr:YlbF family regulator [Bacillota bacterium]MBQ9973288.1 YlbF family regulator [Bacillota bacterium]
MNVYNEAHNLAKAIKECEEFKIYSGLRDQINQVPEFANMINDFQMQQMQLQMKQMAGEEIGPEAMENIQKLYNILMSDPLVGEYMQAEMRFTLMMNDVYKILSEAMNATLPEGM